MNLVFELTNHKSWKSVLIESDRLLLINRRYNSPDEFLEGYNDQGMGRLLKEKKEILLIDIAGMAHNENDPSQLIITKHNGKKVELEYANATELAATATFIAGQKKLSRRVEQMNFWSAVKTPGIGLIITAVLGWIVFTYAEALAKDGMVETSSRRRWLHELLVKIAELLGPTGTLILTGFISAVFVFFILRRVKTPPNQVVYA